jgi:phosphoglycerate transport regulatory protein PgtC
MYTKHLSTLAAVLDPRPSRRALIAGLSAAATGLFAANAHAAEASVVVVTSFPEELTTRYEREFERLHPEYHVQFVWKQSRDAFAFLSQPEQGGADVYWAPSLGNFPALREKGAFRRLTPDRAVLPGRLGAQLLSDPDGFYEAYDVAGYGVVANTDRLTARNLPAPTSWRDLAAPVYAGEIAMPIAGKVGFSPALYDIVLQAEGWDAGWALLSEISAGAQLLSAGNLPTGLVREGKAALGLTIDFFAVSARENGAPVTMIYPKRTAFLPAHIAMTASATHAAAAQAFVDFTLSRDGQKLMTERDSSRHPARPDAYATAPSALIDPFKLSADVTFAYDQQAGRRRPGLVALLFDLLIVEKHDEVVALWRALHEAEARAKGGDAPVLGKARALAGFSPVSAAQALDPAFLDRFADRDARDVALLDSWRTQIAAARTEALAIVKSRI